MRRAKKLRRGFDGVQYELGRAAVYSRVSGPNDTREASVETQEKGTIERLRALGYEVTEEDIFRDKWTGKETIRRKELTRLREACKAGIYRAVGVYKLDRLSRNQGHTFILLGELDERTIRPVSVLEPNIDDSAQGKMYRMMGSYMAEAELATLEDRFGRGRDYLSDQGLPLARGHKPYGYRFEKKPVRRFFTDEDEGDRVGTATWARLIFAQIAAGHSAHFVATYLNDPLRAVPPPGLAKGLKYEKKGHLGLWSANNIRRIVRNPAYKGWMVEGKYYSDGVADEGHSMMRTADVDDWVIFDTEGKIIPAMVDAATWAKANATLDANAKNRNSGTKKTHEYLLRGMMTCYLCGQKMYPTTNRHGHTSYRCALHTLDAQQRTPGAVRCESKYVRGTWIEPLVWGQLRSLIVTPGRLEAAIAKILEAVPVDRAAEELANAEKALATQQKARERLFAKMRAEESQAAPDPDLVESWEQSYRSLRPAIDSLKKVVESLRLKVAASVDPATIAAEGVERFAAARERLLAGDDFTDEEKRDLLKLAGTRVIAMGNGRRESHQGGTGEIHFYLFSQGDQPGQSPARLPQLSHSIVVDLTEVAV